MAKTALEFEAKVSVNELNKLLRELSVGAEGAAKAVNDALGGTVTKKIVLETQTDESGAKRLVAVEKERLSVAGAIETQLKQIRKTESGSLTSLRQQVNEARQARDGIVKYKTAIEGARNEVKTLNPLWAEQNQRLGQLQRQLDLVDSSGFWDKAKTALRAEGFISFLNGLEQITQGLQAANIVIGQVGSAINTLISTAADLQSFALSFKAIGAGAAGASSSLQDSARIALGLGVNIQTVQDGFRQLSPVVLNSGGSLKDVSAIVESLNSRFAAFGISGDRARRVTNGIIQAFAKGKLQAEELTQQISEADPAFKTDLAQAIGKSTQELEEFVKAGQFTTDILIEALPKLTKADLLFGKLGPSAASAVDALEKNAVTIDQVRGNLANLNTLSLRNIAQAAEPLINAFLRAQAVVTDFFSRLSQSGAVKTLADVFARLVNIFTNVLDSLLTLADGFVAVLNAVAPFIDIILKIPGAAEVAGLALIGKFLKPLGLFETALGRSRQSFQDFISSITSIGRGSEASIAIVRNSINSVNEALEQKPTFGLFEQTNKALSSIPSNAKSAVSSVGGVATAVTDRIQSSIAKTDSDIERLRKRLRLVELESQVSAPRTPGGQAVSQAALQEASGREIRSSLGQTSEAFNQTLKNLERYNQGLFGLAANSKNAANGIALPAIKITELKNQLGEPIFGRALKIDPAFLRDVQELAKTDPSKAVTLLQSALRALNTDAKRTQASLIGLSDEGRVAFRAEVASSANQIKNAIAGIAGETEKIKVAPIQNLASSQVALKNRLSETEIEIRRLRAELEKEPSDKLARKVGTDQARIRAELDKSIKKQQTLKAELDKQQAAVRQERRQQVGFEPGQIKESTNSLDKYVAAVRETRREEIIASDTRIQANEKALQSTRTALEQITAEQKKAAQAAQSFRLPVGPFEGTAFQGDEAERLRTEIDRLETAQASLRLEASQLATEETNLKKVFEEASKETATYADRQKALGLSRDVLVQSLKSVGAEARTLQARLGELQVAREALLKQQAARPFFGQVDPSTDPLIQNIKRLGDEINTVKGRLGELDGQKQQSFQGLRQLEIGFLENQKTAGGFSGRLAEAGRGLSNFFKGITVNPLRAFGGALKSAGAAAFSLAESLGPLPFIFLAIGIASRAYADGTRESSEITKRFADQLENLRNALKDLAPETENVATKSSKLTLVWESISLAVASLGDKIGAFLEKLASSFSGFIASIRSILGPLTEVAAGAVLASGAGGLGALIGLALGPWGAAIGGVLGIVTGLLLGTGLAATEASVNVEKLQRSLTATTESVAKQIPVFQELIKELDKLVEPGKGIDPKNLTKFTTGIQQAEASIELMKGSIQNLETGLRKNESAYGGNLKKLDELRAALAAAEQEYEAIKKQGGDSPLTAKDGRYDELVAAEGKVANLRAQITALEDETIKLGTANQKTTDELAKLKQQLEQSEQAYQKLRKEAGLTTEDQKDLTNSVTKLKEAIKALEDSVGEFDLLSPKGREGLNTALSQAKALKTVLEELSKTELEISIELRDLEQQITESQLKIDLEEGPLREAALAISSITNEFATAQQELQTTIAELEFAESKGAVNTQTKAEILERAATRFLASSQKAKEEIVEAGRRFRDELSKARSAYQGLVVDRPEFFTPGEIRKNAQQIEADFKAALDKVRADTGDWSWGPKLTGKTYEEILKQKKEFVDTRNQADDLRKSIQDLNKVLNLLAAVLAKVAGIGTDQLKALGFDSKKLVGDIQDVQKNVTGLGSAATNAAKAYGSIVGEFEVGGKAMVLTSDAATGEIVQLTRAEYDAARGATAVGNAGTAAFGALGNAANSAASAIGSQGAGFSKVVGEFEAGGQKIFLVEDQFTGKVEQVNAAQLKQLGLVSNLNQGYAALGIQIAKAGALTGEYLKRQQEQAARITPESQPIALKFGIDANTVQDVREAGVKAGGDWLKALGETISQGQVFAPLVLEQLANDTTDYRTSLEMLALAQQENTAAQIRYNQALASGSGDILTAAGALATSNATLESARYAADNAAQAYQEAGARAAALGIDIKSVLTAGTEIPDAGPRNLVEAYDAARNKVLEFKGSLEGIDTSADQLESGTSNAEQSLGEGIQRADGMTSSLANAAAQAQAIADSITSLQGLNVNVNVNSVPGLWTGGTAMAGTQYRVNELGQEGFLSAAGRLSAINKPKNALWRAPSTGTVIPAHLWSQLDVPSGGLSGIRKPPGMTAGRNGLQRLAGAIQSALSKRDPARDSALQELSAVQAQQALQIGKLSRAVDRFADKKWDVHVGVKSTGNAAYLEMLNHRL